MTKLSEDDIALAGEYALRLLSDEQVSIVEARIVTDAAFAAEVDMWQGRLTGLYQGRDTAPSSQSWQNISAAIPRNVAENDNGAPQRKWKMLALLSSGIAAALAIILFAGPSNNNLGGPDKPQDSIVATNNIQLGATLANDSGQASVVANYNSGDGQLTMTPVNLDTGKLYPEIWLIPADGKVRSLGMMEAKTATRRNLSLEYRALIAQGAKLAITPEPAGGAPGGKATGPIIASGAMKNIS
jgi:anti-sigma-K factor RskA